MDVCVAVLCGITQCSTKTLCVAAWFPDRGLIVGYGWDTLPVPLSREGATWLGRSLDSPHRGNEVFDCLTGCLGALDGG